MHNLIYLIGRIDNISEEGIIMKVGTQQDNFVTIDVKVALHMMHSIQEYCKEGDLIAIKGQFGGLENNNQVIAEKISFLSSRAKEINEELEEEETTEEVEENSEESLD